MAVEGGLGVAGVAKEAGADNSLRFYLFFEAFRADSTPANPSPEQHFPVFERVAGLTLEETPGNGEMLLLCELTTARWANLCGVEAVKARSMVRTPELRKA